MDWDSPIFKTSRYVVHTWITRRALDLLAVRRALRLVCIHSAWSRIGDWPFEMAAVLKSQADFGDGCHAWWTTILPRPISIVQRMLSSRRVPTDMTCFQVFTK